MNPEINLMVPVDAKVLFIDIETAPSLGYVWGKYDQNVIAFKEDWYVLSFSFKWLGDKKVQTRILPDYKLFKREHQNDKQLVEELWDLFNKADIIVAHHGDGFDIKKSNARFVFHGMKPPAPYKTVDTLKVARKYFKFDSNKLDDLAQYLKIGKKRPHLGFKHTWLDCMKGNMKAWKVMKRYNEHDIYLLEGVYLKLRSWATNHPNLDNFTKLGKCPTCQSAHLQSRGWSFTRTGQRQRFQCRSCGSWSSGVQHLRTV